MPKPILISGGGLASLLLARSLVRSNISCIVFERDKSIDFRGQGYRLRLSVEGLDAIEEVLGPEGFQSFYAKCSKTGGLGFSQFDAVTGELAEQKMPEGLSSREGKVVGISRGDMRQAFLEGCEGCVQWGKNVKGYEETADGVRAVFADGSRSEEGSMLIGGEGLKSEVAKQLSGGLLKVYDTGARGIHGQASTTAFKDLGEGVFRIFDNTHPQGEFMIITNVRPGEVDDPTLKFGWTMAGPPGIIVAPNDDYSIIGKVAADIAKRLTENWHPKFKPLFDQMEEKEAAFWKITVSTPEGVPEWPNSPRVTVIGDAVHSMTPAGGIGANTAVRDSALLGRLLREAGGWKEGITAEYEKEMRVYGSEAVKASWGMAKVSFGVTDEHLKKTIEAGT